MKVRNLRSIRNDVDTEGSWAISYGDMVTLLLAFFIMFFTADKFLKPKEVLQIDILNKALSEPRAPASVTGGAVYPSEETRDKLKTKFYKVGQKMLVEFPGVSFFKSGKFNLNPKGEEAIVEFYKMYQPFVGNFQLSIRAFTDTKKVRLGVNRRFDDNLELSALRSISVMRLLQRTGVPLTSMKLSGYGEMLLTMQDLEKLPEAVRKPTSIDDMARTIMFVIEPKEGP